MAKEKNPPVVPAEVETPAPAIAAVDDLAAAGAEATPPPVPVSSDSESGNTNTSLPDLFNAASIGEPGALPLPGGTIPDTPTETKKEGRGRPRKYATPEEAAAVEAERKRQYRINKKKNAGVPVSPGQIVPDDRIVGAKLGAQTVVFSLDIFRAIISNKECPTDEESRKQLLAAWEQYLIETGKQPPAWIMVTIMSAGYVAPAFDTPSARGRVGNFVNAAKAWWIRKFGG